jgi:two-component system sensor histidine kinase TctE
MVQDNGPGIPVQEKEKVFERFYRVLGSSAPGSGLGLPIVKEIASAHKATVEISDSFENKGTTVTVTFPCVQKSPETYKTKTTSDT